MRVKITTTGDYTMFYFPNCPDISVREWLKKRGYKGKFKGRENAWIGPVSESIAEEFSRKFGKKEKEEKTEPVDNKITNNIISQGLGLAGFISMDELDKKKKSKHPTMSLSGDIGHFFGKLERYQLAFTLEGDQGGGKTRFMYQIADAFAEIGLKIAILSLEIGAQSKLVAEMRDLYIKPQNRSKIAIAGQDEFWELAKKSVSMEIGGDKTATIHTAIKNIAKEYDAIFVDSFGKLRIPTTSIDELRNLLPETIFGFIFQRTTGGTIRGGTAPLFDCGINIDVVKTDSYQNNYAVCTKNRYNSEELKYSIYNKSIIKEEKSE